MTGQKSGYPWHANGCEMVKLKLVIIEDDIKYRDLLQSVFEKEKEYDILGTHGSAESFLKSPDLEEEPDILLLDIELPGMNGIELIPLVKEKSPGLKILILSQFDDDNRIFNGMSQGADGYILKSASIDEILKGVRDIKEGNAPMSPYIASRILEMFREQAQPRKDYKLTGQEKKVLNEIISGLSKKMIADKLFISFHTVDTHIRNIYTKLNVHNQANLVAKTIRERLI